MNPHFRPALGIAPDTEKYPIRYPVFATPKFDGIRVITTDQVPDPDCISLPVCRSMKAVPNRVMRALIGRLPLGLDGEVVTYTDKVMDSFQRVQSKVMADDGVDWTFKYHVFDYVDVNDTRWSRQIQTPYKERLEALYKLDPEIQLPWFEVVWHTVCHNDVELLQFEHDCLEKGFEGICYRVPSAPYKFGRSTAREQYLVKVKRFVTAEAEIIGWEEERHNANTAKTNELGYRSRSSHKDNMVGKDMLGSFLVRPLEGGENFSIGTGFNRNDREVFWKMREQLKGKIVQFKHQPHGKKDRPRIPVFIGFRDKLDMTEEALRDKVEAEQFDLPL